MANIIRVWDSDQNKYVAIPSIKGTPGDTGATFTPSVDSEGNLSWTNDRELDNPETINIKGDTGISGIYLGTEEPTDVRYPVWINTEGSYTDSNAVIVTNIEYTDITVPINDFISDTTYNDLGFMYRASIALEGCDESITPEVIPSLKDIMSGNLAPIAVPYNGGIYIYSKKIPTEDVIIKTINLIKGN